MAGPGWYLMGGAEEAEVLDTLREGHLSRYRFGDETALSRTMLFEQHMAGVLGVRHTLALNSCTSGLLAGLTALGIGPGDEVIVPGYTFIASIAAVLFAGARPVLAEVDESLTLAPDDVEAKVSPRTKAIMPVHMIGAPADLDRLTATARAAGCAVIEDCAQALGGSYRGRRLGSIGDVGAFSLNTGKVITAGDGGLLSTDSTALHRQAFAFHDHGFAPDRAGLVDEGPRIGLNLRLHELAAAVGLAQARKLDHILERCRANKAAVRKELDGLPGVRERVIHDEGECGTAHVLIFDGPEVAGAVAAALGGSPLGASTKHNYARMGQLHAEFGRRDADGRTAVAYGEPGDLPRTDDLLARSVALSVGVVDGYLGTLGDVTVLDSPEEAGRKAARVRDTIETVTASLGERA